MKKKKKKQKRNIKRRGPRLWMVDDAKQTDRDDRTLLLLLIYAPCWCCLLQFILRRYPSFTIYFEYPNLQLNPKFSQFYNLFWVPQFYNSFQNTPIQHLFWGFPNFTVYSKVPQFNIVVFTTYSQWNISWYLTALCFEGQNIQDDSQDQYLKKY